MNLNSHHMMYKLFIAVAWLISRCLPTAFVVRLGILKDFCKILGSGNCYKVLLRCLDKNFDKSASL